MKSPERFPFPRHFITDEPLIADDWKLIHDFIKYVYGPFMRGIVARARERKLACIESETASLPTDEDTPL